MDDVPIALSPAAPPAVPGAPPPAEAAAIVAERLGVPPARVLALADPLDGVRALATRLFADAGGHAVCPSPSAPALAAALRRAGATVHAVAAGEGGIDVEALAARLADGLRPALVAVAPTFGAPVGGVLERPARARLVALARRHRLLLLEDDVERGRAGPAAEGLPPRLLDLDDGVAVAALVAVDDVAALVVPGRIAASVRATLAELQAGGSGAEARRPPAAELASRRQAVVDGVARHLGVRAALVPPRGGSMAWLRLPGVDVAALAPVARRHGVLVEDGRGFCPDGGGADAVPVALAVPAPLLDEGLRRLALALRERDAG